jgi:hypothetical protein
MTSDAVTLIREDTQTVVLTLDAVISGSQVYDGTITDHPMADRSQRSDGITIRPRILGITGRVGTTAGLDAGPAKAGRIVAALRDLQVSQIAVVVQFPGREGIPSMAVERFSEDYDPTDDPPLTIDLKEQRTASSRTVTLAPVAPTPRADVAAGQADVAERGELPTRPVSLARAGARRLVSAVAP